MRYIIFQIFICLGYFVFICSRFLKTKDKMLLLDNVSRVLSIVGYIVGGQINGLEHTLFGIARNKTYRVIKTDRTKKIAFAILLIAVFLMYGLSFNGVSTVFFIASNIINLTAVAFGKEQGVRIGTMLAAVCNMSAFWLTNNIGGLAGEAVIFVMTLVSVVRYATVREDEKHKNKRKRP